MKYVIDTDNYLASGIEVFQFPGGEWHANVPAWSFGTVNVHAKIRTWDDFGKLLVVLSALKHQDVEIHLFMPYAPGLRQDRNPGGLTPLTPEIYAGAVGSFVKTITVVDPHSDIGLDILHRRSNTPIKVLSPWTYLPNLLPMDTYGYVVQPDAGAQVRTVTTAEILGLNPKNQILVCEKHRDFNTGKLTGFKIPEKIRTFDAGTRILLPDDICDGGGTFLGLLNIIKDFNPDVLVDLFVTHAVFSNNALNRLLTGEFHFEHIYTTDSWFDPIGIDVTDVTSVELLPYYLGGLHP